MTLTQQQFDERLFERFQLIINGPALFSAIVAGVELGIFDFLQDAPGAMLDDIREHTALPAHQLRVLMLALCATELIQKEDGHYTVPAITRRLLSNDEGDSWSSTLVGFQRFQYPAFRYTTEALKTGRNVALDMYSGSGEVLYDRMAHSPEVESAYHDWMGPLTVLYAKALLDRPEFSSVRHLLDVGGGDGTTALEFVQRNPGAEVTVFDMPTIAARGQVVTSRSLPGSVHFHEGDIFQDRFPGHCDAILFSHVLEPFSPEQNMHLIKKAVDAIPAGGRIFLYGNAIADDETRGPLSARLSIYLNVLVSGTGMAYPVEDYAAWAREAGCATVDVISDMPYEHGLVVAAK